MVNGDLIKSLFVVHLTFGRMAFVAETEMCPNYLAFTVGKPIKRIENGIVLFHMDYLTAWLKCVIASDILTALLRIFIGILLIEIHKGKIAQPTD